MASFNKHPIYDRRSILVLTPEGKLRKLYTPFRARCIISIGPLHVNTTVFVDEVIYEFYDRLRFRIDGQLFAYRYFSIQVMFKE
jgi:hypothetical protein